MHWLTWANLTLSWGATYAYNSYGDKRTTLTHRIQCRADLHRKRCHVVLAVLSQLYPSSCHACHPSHSHRAQQHRRHHPENVCRRSLTKLWCLLWNNKISCNTSHGTWRNRVAMRGIPSLLSFCLCVLNPNLKNLHPPPPPPPPPLLRCICVFLKTYIVGHPVIMKDASGKTSSARARTAG